MSDYISCSKCGEFSKPSTHKCPPLWDTWRLDRGETRDTGGSFHAYNAESAAEKCIEDDDSCDADFTDECEVCVAKVGEEKVQTFRVTGEMVASYHAKEVGDGT